MTDCHQLLDYVDLFIMNFLMLHGVTELLNIILSKTVILLLLKY